MKNTEIEKRLTFLLPAGLTLSERKAIFDRVELLIQEQIRLCVESCPCEEEDLTSKMTMDAVFEDMHRDGFNQHCQLVKKWKKSLLE